MTYEYKFGRGEWKTIEQGNQREWIISNGLGGYANHSIIGGGFRFHHGYLNAAIKSPTLRYQVFTRTQEQIKIGNRCYDLTSQEYLNWSKNGQEYLQRFTFDGVPNYHYQVEDIFIKKTIAMDYGHNTTVVCYDVENGIEEATLNIVPLFNYRPLGSSSEKSELVFESFIKDNVLTLVPGKNKKIKIKFFISKGKYYDRSLLPTSMAEPCHTIEENHFYRFENTTGHGGLDNHYTPYDIKINLKPLEKGKFYITCTTEELPQKDGFAIIDEYKKRMKSLVDKGGYNDRFVNKLIEAADHFIVKRESTGLKTILAGLPWFTDWGRDTMIAFQGLTLVTKRFDDAREILESFSRYVHNGLIPNLFPEGDEPPKYNTVDASMWYFHSVDQYLKYTGDYKFIRDKIYPKLKEIIEAYKNGTDFSIGMDSDGLIRAGSGYDQVTWMDVRVGDWVVTPRHGKPVEINALWYNALMVMKNLAERYNDDPIPYEELAKKVNESFNHKFWNEELQCLFDVIDERDAKIRPNQIWAVSLPYSMLDERKSKKVVEVVHKHLYSTYGLRSLSHEDPKYKGKYMGKLINRDGAYHMGTVWAFPLGAFISAYCKVNNYSVDAVKRAKRMCLVFEDHLRDGCVNGIAEIFDGDFSSVSRGCFSQGWSVGEILRAYVEDVLPYDK